MTEHSQSPMPPSTPAEPDGPRPEKEPVLKSYDTILYYLVGIIICIIAFCLLCGCASARRSEPVTGSMPVLSDAARHGQIVFMAHCQQCHPGGEAGLGPALNNKPLPGLIIKAQVRLGLGAMPSLSRQVISSPDLDDVVQYLKTLRHHR